MNSVAAKYSPIGRVLKLLKVRQQIGKFEYAISTQFKFHHHSNTKTLFLNPSLTLFNPEVLYRLTGFCWTIFSSAVLLNSVPTITQTNPSIHYITWSISVIPFRCPTSAEHGTVPPPRAQHCWVGACVEFLVTSATYYHWTSWLYNVVWCSVDQGLYVQK